MDTPNAEPRLRSCACGDPFICCWVCGGDISPRDLHHCVFRGKHAHYYCAVRRITETLPLDAPNGDGGPVRSWREVYERLLEFVEGEDD